MKKILVISSSPRKGGNSDMLCDQFIKGAEEKGNKSEKIRLCEYKINYCLGCNYCSKNKANCVQQDDMASLLEKMVAADVIVLATPVYFYAMCGQLKTFIDRCCPRYQEITNKEFYYLLSAAEEDKDMLSKVIEELRGFSIDCLVGTQEKGTIFGINTWDMGDVKTRNSFIEAYEMGKSI